jgi:hypothetical protein
VIDLIAGLHGNRYLKRSFLAVALALLCLPVSSEPAIHYAPAENLEHIDVALIDTAAREIDFAAYVLTDWAVIQALTRAADRGVKVRIYLDGTQLAERWPSKSFFDLAETPGVEIKIKDKASAPMHIIDAVAKFRRGSARRCPPLQVCISAHEGASPIGRSRTFKIHPRNLAQLLRLAERAEAAK